MGVRQWRGQISIQLKEKYERKIQRNKELFEDRSVTEEMYNRIDNIIENAETLEEKIEKKEKDLEAEKNRLEELRKMKKNKDRKKELKRLKGKYEKIQSKIKKVEKEGQRTRKEIEKDILDHYRGKSTVDNATEDEEIKEKLGDNFDRLLESRLENQEDLEELRNEKSEIRDRIDEIQEDDSGNLD